MTDESRAIARIEAEVKNLLARWAGMLTALLAVLQAGWALFGDPIRAALLGGPR